MKKTSIYLKQAIDRVKHYTIYDIVDEDNYGLPIKGKEILDYKVREGENDNKLKGFLLKNKYEDKPTDYSESFDERMDAVKNRKRNKYVAVRITGSHSGMFQGIEYYKKKNTKENKIRNGVEIEFTRKEFDLIINALNHSSSQTLAKDLKGVVFNGDKMKIPITPKELDLIIKTLDYLNKRTNNSLAGSLARDLEDTIF